MSVIKSLVRRRKADIRMILKYMDAEDLRRILRSLEQGTFNPTTVRFFTDASPRFLTTSGERFLVALERVNQMILTRGEIKYLREEAKRLLYGSSTHHLPADPQSTPAHLSR